METLKIWAEELEKLITAERAEISTYRPTNQGETVKNTDLSLYNAVVGC